MKKIQSFLLFVGIVLFASNAGAVTLKISRTVSAHNSGQNPPDYANVYREVTDHYSQMEPTKLIQRDINIQCYGNGTSSCPTSIVAPSDNPLHNIPMNVILFAQDKFDPYCLSIDREGVVPDAII